MLAPLRNPLFFALLTTAFAANIGIWMQEVGASWLMTSIAPSPLMVSLIQTAANLPYFLMGVIAGALADIADRRRLLILAQALILTSAGTLGVLTLLHFTTPWVLLGLSFSVGIGAALNGPGWHAIVPELVEHSEIHQAITLNSVQHNAARGIGPAVGGMVVSAWGAGAAFLCNASSILGIVGMLLSWRRERHKSMLPAERVFGAIRAGARYVHYTPAMRSVVVRALLFAMGVSAMWATLPLGARLELHLNATGYGILIAFFGVGAGLGGGVVSRARHTVSSDALAISGGVLFAAVNATLAWTHDVHVLWLALFVAGAAWVSTTTMYHSSAQLALASWVRARALSLYLLSLQGGLALGSVLWGYLATRVGIRNALDCSALLLMVAVLLVIALRLSLSVADDFDPEAWVLRDLPVLHQDLAPARGPIVIDIEYRIDLARAAEFERAVHALEPIRRRDGAVTWGIFSDVSDPSRYLEMFVVETWGEHLRQHYRFTASDRDAEDHARSFHIGPEPVVIRHLVAPPRRN
jgi:MFS family permease